MMITIAQTEQLQSVLDRLKPQQGPLFGIMTPQEMVEHLLFFVEISSGLHPQVQFFSDERALKNKQYLIYSENALAPGVKMPLMNGMPQELQCKDLAEANAALIQATIQFNQTAESPDYVHPALGLMSRAEWKIFHDKHFTHHFKQFGLI
ncbi:DUF1569 domain-containing protein [Edaphocola flava]|uniref:DUF1569 domain-containing protein n=1 Tax=Edaphocola flava TaxID=2499629 RepID=UPI00100A9E58|nr:DUF1569 domain-containing protein [Edaphocola flava]